MKYIEYGDRPLPKFSCHKTTLFGNPSHLICFSSLSCPFGTIYPVLLLNKKFVPAFYINAAFLSIQVEDIFV